MPAFPDLVTPLKDDRVVLRSSAERDIPEILIAYQDDPRLHLRMGEPRPPSGAELGRRTEQERGERIAGTNVTLTILEPGSDLCRGQLYVHHVDWDHQRAELGIWLAPQVRGKSLASSALRTAGAWLIRACGFQRVQVVTEPDNEPMIRAARAAGFADEGVLRGYLRRGTSRVDAVVLALLPGDLSS